MTRRSARIILLLTTVAFVVVVFVGVLRPSALPLYPPALSEPDARLVLKTVRHRMYWEPVMQLKSLDFSGMLTSLRELAQYRPAQTGPH